MFAFCITVNTKFLLPACAEHIWEQTQPMLGQAPSGCPGLQLESGRPAASLPVPASAFGASCSLHPWLGHCPEITTSSAFPPLFLYTDSCFSIYKFCLLVSEWWWPSQSDTLSFTMWQTAWNCWHKQLVCFVLTLKEDAIWNHAYFKNKNSYLCLTDLITLRGPKFVILCKI